MSRDSTRTVTINSIKIFFIFQYFFNDGLIKYKSVNYFQEIVGEFVDKKCMETSQPRLRGQNILREEN